MLKHSIILCPLYNDAESFDILIKQLEIHLSTIDKHRFSILVVNDGSYIKPQIRSNMLPCTVIHLHRNIGHQKAIAIGLAYLNQHETFDGVIIMDSDGEDRPEDIETLINASYNNEEIIFASRQSRQEGRKFRLFYNFYKLFFWLLTYRKISFGNFMLISRERVRQIVFYSEIWNHLAGGIIKSNIPYKKIPIHRGKRYSGASRMNFTGLLLHGLGAIGVFIDIIASRLLIFSIAMILLSLLAISIITAIKLFTTYAIPGWASTLVSSMMIVLLQSFLLSLFTIFLYQLSQSQRRFIPAHHFTEYVNTVEKNNATHTSEL